jgi:hypothetical protein
MANSTTGLKNHPHNIHKNKQKISPTMRLDCFLLRGLDNYMILDEQAFRIGVVQGPLLV